MNGLTTNYALDLNTGLTQVLADTGNVYLYGNGRVGERQAGGWQYHHADGLGSLRSLTNASATMTLNRRYEPYGSVLDTSGAATSIYGYTGEQQSGGLVYLRARYYASGLGRFVSRDTWQGEYSRGLSLNRWTYVEANPIGNTDPTGHLTNDVIARGFGLSGNQSFPRVLAWFRANAPKHWALLAALQAAETYDTLGVGSDNKPDIQVKVAATSASVWLIDQRTNYVYRSIREFAQAVVGKGLGEIRGSLWSPNGWEINMYSVTPNGSATPRYFKAYNQWATGIWSRWGRSPDLQLLSADICAILQAASLAGASLATCPSFARFPVQVRPGVVASGQLVYDRYGNARIGIEYGFGAGFSLANFARGWAELGESPAKPTEAELASVIEGLAWNASVSFWGSFAVSRGVTVQNVGGVDLAVPNGNRIFWLGASVGGGVTVCSQSVTSGPLQVVPEVKTGLAWDWVDTMPSITQADVRTR